MHSVGGLRDKNATTEFVFCFLEHGIVGWGNASREELYKTESGLFGMFISIVAPRLQGSAAICEYKSVYVTLIMRVCIEINVKLQFCISQKYSCIQ
jgi:hypothetical protein